MFSGILHRLGNDIEIMSRTTDVIMSTDGWKNGVGRMVFWVRVGRKRRKEKYMKNSKGHVVREEY